MVMGVVHIGKVLMFVPDGVVPVHVAVRFSRRVFRPMDVLMVLIMNMRVRVLHAFMKVFMIVLLSGMQPDADRH